MATDPRPDALGDESGRSAREPTAPRWESRREESWRGERGDRIDADGVGRDRVVQEWVEGRPLPALIAGRLK